MSPRGDGDCYEVAAYLVALDGELSGFLVCHGEATGRGPIAGVRFGHAWVEGDLGGLGTVVFDFSNGLSTIIPRDHYYALGEIDADRVRRYTEREALEMMLRTGHFGPWDDEADAEEGDAVLGSSARAPGMVRSGDGGS